MIRKATPNVITSKASSGDASNYRFVLTTHRRLKPLLAKNDRDYLIRPIRGFLETEFVTADERTGDSGDNQQPNPVPRRELRSAAECGLAGLVVVLAVSAGLAFVIWMFWALAMGYASIDTYDLAEAIRGYR